MLSYLLRQLTNSFGIFFRTIRAFFTRKLVGAWSYLRRITNFSRQATKVATASFQGAATAVKKPTKREDYIETQRLFISKSFLILLAIGLVIAGLLAYFVVWPFILSHFLTARFYYEDEKLSDWSGRVIVCYDEEKQNPMYQGTLEDGLLQGKGREYDEAGLLRYEGNFVDGQRSGDGCLYEAGVLVYEGQFSDGEINGTGTAYEDGVKCYQGAFVDGLYEGSGTAYYPNGTKVYVGSFSAGVYEGEGTAYSEDGQICYKGSYSQGLYEGEGTAYDDEGRICYKGSFSAGLYEGSGTVYRADGDRIQSEFTAGVAGGTIQWYKNGKLWYDGSADDLVPDGFGTLYAENGKVVYAGEFDRGTLDGAWLLDLTTAELREVFGEASLTEWDVSSGFCVENEVLGLTALCSFQQGETESKVYQIWFSPQSESIWAELLPWETGSEAVRWANLSREERPEEYVYQGTYRQPDGSADQEWYQRQYYYESYACTILSTDEKAAPVQICWNREMTQAGGGGADLSESQAQERLEQLLASLDGAGGSASGGSSGSGAGLGDVERLLGLMLTAQDGEALIDALIDCCVYGEMLTALEASQPLLQQELAQAQTQLQRGQGSQTEVDAAQAALNSLDERLAQYRTNREQAELTVQELSKLSAADYDLQPVLLIFDPVELEVSALYDAALSYAQSAAAGQQEVDAAALEQEIKSTVLDLSLAYETVLSARTTAESAAAQVETAIQDYSKGTADRAALYDAQCARNEATAALYQAMGTFAHYANSLNTLSGGWVAERFDWMADTFATLFQSEILRGEAAAQAAEDERTQREEEAKEQIQAEQASDQGENESSAPSSGTDGAD